MKFLGVDLGWVSGDSGLCCLSWDDDHLTLSSLDRRIHVEDILQWIDYLVQSSETAVIAVDAPTLIPNKTGMRLPDRLAHQHFGKYHAGCYPANLNRPFAARTVSFGRQLEQRGFVHDPAIASPKPVGRYQLEVFPHAAMIHLFRLNRIIKYKKGRVAERKAGLAQLRTYILNVLPALDPPLKLTTPIPDIPTTGVELKRLEDRLDSLICAYTAAHWWYWGTERNWVLGDRTSGYIVVPTPFGKLNSGQVVAR